MKLFGILLLGILFSLRICAREINVRLWISGGTRGLVLGNRECPGWLSLARQLQETDPEGCWVHLGVPPLAAGDLKIPGLKFPDVLIPTEEDFRLDGRASLEEEGLPFTVSNVSRLPQFPDYEPSFAPSHIWKQADGVEIHSFGLLSLQAVLRIPPDRLRPLQILDPLEFMRGWLTEHPISGSVLPVLALPENADASEWSTRFPEIPVLILPPGTRPKITGVHGGSQLRVQPARFGRALIRIQLYWDTVEQKFRNPTAEVVWVRAPDLQGLNLSPDVVKHLRPLNSVPDLNLEKTLLSYADAVLLPEIDSLDMGSRLPDAIRVGTVPEDQTWLKTRVPRSVWNRWKQLPDFKVLEAGNLPAEVEVLITGQTLAGNGDWHSPIRQELLSGEYDWTWMPFTSRDLLLSLENAP